MNFYSQNGEDFLAHQLFKGNKTGFFVEIGCIDGKRFSNTLAFEDQGWLGICIEAHSGYIELLKQNRPKSEILHCAVGPEDGKEITFYANARGSLSTVDNSREKDFEVKYGKYFTGFEEQKIPMRSINSIFDELGVNSIDLFSLDIEGYEIEAMKGLDLSRYKPKLMIIESDKVEHEKELDAIILPHDYHKLFRLNGNIFYGIDPSFRDVFKSKRFAFELIYTEHPLDNNGDEYIKKTVDFNSKNILKKIFQRDVEFCKLLD